MFYNRICNRLRKIIVNSLIGAIIPRSDEMFNITPDFFVPCIFPKILVVKKLPVSPTFKSLSQIFFIKFSNLKLFFFLIFGT